MFLRFKRSTPIGDLKPGGEAIVEGRVKARATLSLPGSGTTCVYYDQLVESFGRGARGGGRPFWMPQSAEQKLAGFFVEDSSGKVWVDADAQAVKLGGAPTEAGAYGAKGKKRYTARLLREGFVVKLHGAVDNPRGKEPSGTLVMRPRADGHLEALVRKTS
jgi:hypothetical protein